MAAPKGLEEVREAFQKTLTEYNESDATARGVTFIPVGWESTRGGVGRPQSLINKDIRRCDFLVLVLWNRWGSSPDKKGSGEFSSGTEEEYHLAMNLLQDSSQPMRHLVVFFKAVDNRQLSDPGPQLQKVLDFRKKLETDKTLYYHTFDELFVFEKRLRHHLAAWVREHEGGQTVEVTAPGPSLKRPSIDVMFDFPGEREGGEASELVRRAQKLADEGRFTEAETAFAQAAVGEDDWNVLDRYGVFLYKLGRLSQSRQLFERALELSSRTGNEYVQFLSLNNLAAVLFDLAKYEAAEPLMERSLEISEREFGPDHPYMAAALNNLGMLYQGEGRFDKAEEFLRQALERYQKALSPDDPMVAMSLSNLGTLYSAERRYEEAEELTRQALDIKEKILGPKDPRLALSLNNLGSVLRNQGRYDEAEPLFRRALEIVETAFGPDHLRIAVILNNLARVVLDQGRYDEVEPFLERALEIRERIFEPDHPAIARILRNLGVLRTQQERYDEAAEYLQKALDIVERVLGTDHPRLADILKAFADLLMRTGREEEAEEMRRRASTLEGRSPSGRSSS